MNEFQLVYVDNGLMASEMFESILSAMRAYREKVIELTRLYGESHHKKPKTIWLQYTETAFVAVYAPNWREIAFTRIYPWEC